MFIAGHSFVFVLFFSTLSLPFVKLRIYSRFIYLISILGTAPGKKKSVYGLRFRISLLISKDVNPEFSSACWRKDFLSHVAADRLFSSGVHLHSSQPRSASLHANTHVKTCLNDRIKDCDPFSEAILAEQLVGGCRD